VRSGSTSDKPEGIFYIPIHHGWLGIERDASRIAEVVRERFYKRLGNWGTITKTDLAAGKEAILMRGAPATDSVPV